MNEFLARFFLLLQVKTMFLLMVISALGTIFDYSRWVWTEKHRIRVAISGTAPPDGKKSQGTDLPVTAIAAKWRSVLDEWIAPVFVWAAVIAMTVSVAGMLLAEE